MRKTEQHSQYQKSNNKAIIGNQRASRKASLFFVQQNNYIIQNVISYYQSWNKDEIYDSIETVFDTNQIGILLADSFFWEESKEGYEFWFNIYKEIRSLRI